MAANGNPKQPKHAFLKHYGNAPKIHNARRSFGCWKFSCTAAVPVGVPNADGLNQLRYNLRKLKGHGRCYACRLTAIPVTPRIAASFFYQ